MTHRLQNEACLNQQMENDRLIFQNFLNYRFNYWRNIIKKLIDFHRKWLIVDVSVIKELVKFNYYSLVIKQSTYIFFQFQMAIKFYNFRYVKLKIQHNDIAEYHNNLKRFQ